jgi:hypothetical protein
VAFSIRAFGTTSYQSSQGQGFCAFARILPVLKAVDHAIDVEAQEVGASLQHVCKLK